MAGQKIATGKNALCWHPWQAASSNLLGTLENGVRILFEHTTIPMENGEQNTEEMQP